MLVEIKGDIDSGKLIENAKKCKAANQFTSKGCYEAIYGEIKEGGGAKAGGNDDEGGVCKGKCTIF